jgi:hypothetical protein
VDSCPRRSKGALLPLEAIGNPERYVHTNDVLPQHYELAPAKLRRRIRLLQAPFQAIGNHQEHPIPHLMA